MARVSKLVLLLFAFLLSTQILQASARPNPDDDDDDDGWGMFSSEEEQVEAKPEADLTDHHTEQNMRALGANPSGGGSDQHIHHTGHGQGHAHHDHPKTDDGIQHKQQLQNEDQAKSGFWGGNIAGFNETCGGSGGKMCNAQSNIECSTSNFCTCMPKHIYIRSQEKCFEVARDDGDCRYDDQCHNGKWGRLSRCEETTARCQCYDAVTSGKREVAWVADTCVLKKRLNEPCEMDRECQATMKEDAVCAPPAPGALPGWSNATETCQCREGFVFDNLKNQCIKIADTGLAFECMDDLQCTASPLGNLSRCSRETKKCECEDPTRPGKENVVFYKPRGTCFAKKNWNDTCLEHDECKASISSEAECFVNYDTTIRGMTCQCPQGKVCPLDADGGGAFALGSSTFNVAFFVMVVIFGVFKV